MEAELPADLDSELRLQRIMEIRKALTEGTYQIDAEKVVTALMRNEGVALTADVPGAEGPKNE